MSPTLVVGNSYPAFSSDIFSVNQIVVYRPPTKFRTNENVVWAHRLTGVSGDSLKMKSGVLFLNGRQYPYKIALKHSFIVKASMPLNERRLKGFEYSMNAGNDEYVFYSTPEEIAQLKKNSAVKEIISKIYQADQEDDLNGLCVVGSNRDNWGPVRIPKNGDTVLITENNLRQYENVLKEYESVANVKVGEQYKFTKDYFFVLGDNRHNSLDSRYIGFIPKEDVLAVLNDPE